MSTTARVGSGCSPRTRASRTRTDPAPCRTRRDRPVLRHLHRSAADHLSPRRRRGSRRGGGARPEARDRDGPRSEARTCRCICATTFESPMGTGRSSGCAHIGSCRPCWCRCSRHGAKSLPPSLRLVRELLRNQGLGGSAGYLEALRRPGRRAKRCVATFLDAAVAGDELAARRALSDGAGQPRRRDADNTRRVRRSRARRQVVQDDRHGRHRQRIGRHPVRPRRGLLRNPQRSKGSHARLRYFGAS